MDPIEAIDIQGDSSFVLALEAQRRGHGLFHYLPSALSLKDGRVYARMQPLEVRREAGNHFTLGTPQTIDLATLDVVLMRQDPPFDMAYIRSEEHTSELQSLMRISYAVFCLKKKKS